MSDTLDALIAKKGEDEALAEEAKKLLGPAKISGLLFTKSQIYNIISERLNERKFFGDRKVVLSKSSFLQFFIRGARYKFYDESFATPPHVLYELSVEFYLKHNGEILILVASFQPDF